MYISAKLTGFHCEARMKDLPAHCLPSVFIPFADVSV
jgi:hypothetical protein